MRSLLLGFTIFLFACGTKEPVHQPPNRWADARLMTVLDAQEHRDVPTLCALLNDTSDTVRAAAALAFASVQDSTATSCLFGVLQDPAADVRVNAVFALAYILNDSTGARLAEFSDSERDSTVHRAYLSTMFLSLQRRGKLKQVSPLLYYLDRSTGQERMRAADAIRRLPMDTLRSFGAEYLKLTTDEKDPDVQAPLIRGLGALEGEAHLAPLKEWALHGNTRSIRISAIRALGRSFERGKPIAFYTLLRDSEPMVRAATLEQLNSFGDHLNADSLLTVLPRLDRTDKITWFKTLALLRRTTKGERIALDSLRAQRPTDPYALAEWIPAMATSELVFADDSLSSIMLGDGHAAIRQAAFSVLLERVYRRMTMQRAITPDMQVRQAAPFYHSVFASGDPGLISAVAEALRTTPKEALTALFPKEFEEKALSALQPIRDLEAIILLRELAGRRDGLASTTHGPLSFNHAIDRQRLLVLKQGQRYRITTAKGEIVLATDVNECPGTSLAFDSLVTAGYYDGKAFHRVVPDFVAQGGCPRGDGFCGMPWTLRTEIGRTPFTTGSVGLASAGRDTESCQFFITHSPTPHLDGRYTRFGEVVSGMDVVWKLQVGDVMERVERID